MMVADLQHPVQIHNIQWQIHHVRQGALEAMPPPRCPRRPRSAPQSPALNYTFFSTQPYCPPSQSVNGNLDWRLRAGLRGKPGSAAT